MFVVNEDYNRQDLLSFIGSKQGQSGIIWGNKEPNCVIVTSGGKHAEAAGYGDRENEDGTWFYSGQGSTGDQDVSKKANKLLADKQHNVLLFSSRVPKAKERLTRLGKGQIYTFKGVFDVLSYTLVDGTGRRQGDKLLRFTLIPAGNIFDTATSPLQSEDVPNTSLSDLRKKIQAEDRDALTRPSSAKEYRVRSMHVKAYALLRAKGICELCNRDAPFKTASDIGFLEVHHIHKLADDGPDEPGNVAAVCPNCHRAAHFSTDKEKIKKQSIASIAAKELVIAG